MVKEYLEKIRRYLFEKRIEASNKLMDLSNKYKENVALMKLLDESNDPVFESFTPREINSFNRGKIVEIKESQKQLIADIKIVEDRLKQLDVDIEEVDNVIRTYNKESSN